LQLRQAGAVALEQGQPPFQIAFRRAPGTERDRLLPQRVPQLGIINLGE
jgi:hypothetical protein